MLNLKVYHWASQYILPQDLRMPLAASTQKFKLKVWMVQCYHARRANNRFLYGGDPQKKLGMSNELYINEDGPEPVIDKLLSPLMEELNAKPDLVELEIEYIIIGRIVWPPFKVSGMNGWIPSRRSEFFRWSRSGET